MQCSLQFTDMYVNNANKVTRKLIGLLGTTELSGLITKLHAPGTIKNKTQIETATATHQQI